MYRTTDDFLQDWQNYANGTLQVYNALTDDKLDQSIVEGHNTLGWLAWHITVVTGAFGKQAGLEVDTVDDPTTVPKEASEIARVFKKVTEQIQQGVEGLSDDEMLAEVEVLGQTMPRGKVFSILLQHNIHHRGQMTVLLRQAGLEVPGVMGPTKENQ
ncbi:MULTISPECIES: DinB family protein [Allobacillus]|uniref:Damage-inducible protein DinB n=1 Tax=Allobacillus salarius TaxID=1955272 RepID=A0A556PA73_9BACI|nr:DinB family protein [Allobacillus salarius]TSJ61266.1 damage-inducible protein DinB [Allobacillus salarius]